ncbi:MAG: hypothetical protein ACK5Q5_24290, partial [Planctomycetaceae bacterium]
MRLQQFTVVVAVVAVGLVLMWASSASAQLPPGALREGGHSVFPGAVSQGYPEYGYPQPTVPLVGEPVEMVNQSRGLTTRVGLDVSTTFPLLDFQNRQGDKQLILRDQAAKVQDFPYVVRGAQFRAA